MADKIGRAVLSIELDDAQYNAAMAGVAKTAKATADDVKGIRQVLDFAAFTGAAVAAYQGIKAVAQGIVELGIQGAAVADVSSAFEGLTARVGGSHAVLDALRAGVGGTISDFELMQTANKALGAGLKASAAEMQTLAAGAKMLADRTGGDTKDAFDALTKAVVTGKTKGLYEFGLGAKEAAEILPLLQAQLAAAGDGGLDFADDVDIVRATLDNLHNSVALVTASVLPDLVAQFRGVGLQVGDVSAVTGQALNLIANGMVNMASISVNAITAIVQAMTAVATTVSSQAQVMWDVLTGKVGVREAFASITALGAQGFDTVRAAVERALTPTLTWKDYLAGGGTAARMTIPALGELASAAEANAKRIADAEQQKAMILFYLRENEYNAMKAFSLLQQQETDANYALLIPKVTNFYTQTMLAAQAAGFQTRGELEATAAKAEETYQRMLQSGLYTEATLQAAKDAAETAKQAAKEKTTEYEMSQNDALMSGSLQILGVLGQKFKAAAIAGAIISTYQAVAKALAAAPWPANLVLAAGAAAAGWANVSKIRSSQAGGYKEGTPGLDFAGFGAETVTALHGREAVIPQGKGHLLAGEIADALPGAGDGGTLAELRALRDDFARMPAAMVRAWRHAMALS